jgi:hypothetical protein
MRSRSIELATPEDDIFGEVPLAPSALTGVSEAELARAMLIGATRPHAQEPRTRLEPLSAPLAAVAALIRR